MHLKDLSIFEFNKYALQHPLGSYHQTTNYALFMSERGYDYDLIGLVDDENNIHAASLILYKKLNFFIRIAYAPKGFLIDYHDTKLLKCFSELLIKRYYKKNFAFITINPEICIGNIDIENKKIIYNENKEIERQLSMLKYERINEKKHFENRIPKFNAIIKLKDFSLKNISKSTRNKINKSLKNGLALIKGTREDIANIYPFFKNKKKYKIEHYYNYYNAFNKEDLIDIFLVKMDFEKCLTNIKKQYETELEYNNSLVNKFLKENNEENLKRKLESDKNLSFYKGKIKELTDSLAENKETYIAGAITIKYKNRVHILISGFDQKYKNFCSNHFLHYKLIEHYKKDYSFFELNGITGDFNSTNPYKGLDDFKLGFNPYACEYIGEYNFIINEGLYKTIIENDLLKKNTNKK